MCLHYVYHDWCGECKKGYLCKHNYLVEWCQGCINKIRLPFINGIINIIIDYIKYEGYTHNYDPKDPLLLTN